MTTAFHGLRTHIDVLAIKDYEEISNRFLQGFPDFIHLKKQQAVYAILQDEIQNESVVRNDDFVQSVINRMDDESILEKRYIFISINPLAKKAALSR